MAKAIQPVSLDGIEFDALMSSENTFEASVPEYSVEDGFSVSDTVLLGEERLSLVLYLTDTPVTWAQAHAGPGRVAEVVNQLKQKYYDKQPVTVVTSEEIYENMAIESISINKSLENGYAREIPISLRKIRITETRTATIPSNYGRSGPTKANAGTASTVDYNSGYTAEVEPFLQSFVSTGGLTGNNGSIAYNILTSLGIIH